MKIGIMQPYFLSYLGYYSLIRQVDRYLVFDTAQYIYHGWINRNRILKPGGADWQYIQVPVKKHARTDAIKDVLIDNEKPWRERIFGADCALQETCPFLPENRRMVERNMEWEFRLNCGFRYSDGSSRMQVSRNRDADGAFFRNASCNQTTTSTR